MQFYAELTITAYPYATTLLHLLDPLATFAFALVGARVAADKGLDYGGIALIAAVASLAGGTLHRETIGTSTLIGSAAYVLLHQLGNGDNEAAIIGGAVVVITRLLSIKFDLHLPKFKN